MEWLSALYLMSPSMILLKAPVYFTSSANIRTSTPAPKWYCHVRCQAPVSKPCPYPWRGPALQRICLYLLKIYLHDMLRFCLYIITLLSHKANLNLCEQILDATAGVCRSECLKLRTLLRAIKIMTFLWQSAILITASKRRVSFCERRAEANPQPA